MPILLTIVVIACLVWLFHPRFNPQFAKPKHKSEEKPQALSHKEATIMGKSKFVLSQSKPNEATESQTDKGLDKERTFDPGDEKSSEAQIPIEKLDKAFLNTPEPDKPNDPLEVDVDEESENEPDDMDLDEEAEELMEMLGNDISSADGVSYDDMNGANKTVLANDPSPEEEEQAGEVFQQIRPTDMFEQMIAGNEEKEDKVKILMAKNLKKHFADTEATGGVKKDLSTFIN